LGAYDFKFLVIVKYSYIISEIMTEGDMVAAIEFELPALEFAKDIF
jgi:hypothetical protein